MTSIMIPPEKLDRSTRIAGLHCEWRGQTTEQEGQPVWVVENQHCRAVIAYQGAQVLEYQRHDHPPLLWMSEAANYMPQRAIRGGIPLCFPWFGKHPTNPDIISHGFARNLPWSLHHAIADETGHVLYFTLQECDESLAIWPYRFQTMLEVHLGESLRLTFSVANSDETPFDFTFAFHSYFAVPDIDQVAVTGLEQVPFYNQLAPEAGYDQREADPIRFTAETDRIYQGGQGRYQIETGVDAHDIWVLAPECPSAVVWNPWVEKTARLGDMPPDAWQHMVCVECGRVGDEVVTLQPGQLVSYELVLAN